MTSLYERVQEIKKATGWSQERIGMETGLALSTIGRIFRVPGYSGNETSHILIRQLYEKVVRSPFSDYLDRLFNRYDRWKTQYPKKEFSELLDILEVLLKNHKDLHSDSLDACRLRWLLGHIYFDRAFYLYKYEELRWAQLALEWYENALEGLQKQGSDLLVQQYKLQQCIVSTRFNLCEPGKRADNADIRRWLQSIDYLNLVATVLKEDNWNWMAARNGLVAASILQDGQKCKVFWYAMQAANQHFEDPHFEPEPNMPAIMQDPDLSWFREYFLEAHQVTRHTH